MQDAPYKVWSTTTAVATLLITTDAQVLADIKKGYADDQFCVRLKESGMCDIQNINGLWYIRSHLIIPRTGTTQENLFHPAHNTLGHFRSEKSYASLRDCYYWPNIRKDLESSYIPGCIDCQYNKSRTTRLPGLLL